MLKLKPVYLRTIRTRQELTQVDLAHLTGLAQNTISKLESKAHARPVWETCLALARALNVDPARLRFGPDPNKRLPTDGRRRFRARDPRKPAADAVARDVGGPRAGESAV